MFDHIKATLVVFVKHTDTNWLKTNTIHQLKPTSFTDRHIHIDFLWISTCLSVQ